MKITYHAWLREMLHKNEEVLHLKQPLSLEEIIMLLKKRDNVWEETFQNTKTLRFAVNQQLCKDIKTTIYEQDVLSIFPPFTGG